MHSGRLVFAQLMDHLPLHSFRRCVARYGGNHRVQSFTCLDQFLCMAFAQLTSRPSLRAIVNGRGGNDVKACVFWAKSIGILIEKYRDSDSKVSAF